MNIQASYEDVPVTIVAFVHNGIPKETDDITLRHVDVVEAVLVNTNGEIFSVGISKVTIVEDEHVPHHFV